MNDLSAKLRLLTERFERAAAERDDTPEPVLATPRRRQRARRANAALTKAATIDDLLVAFTATSAYAFIFERTVPPAAEDGSALIASYPELAEAAPELVADMAVAFRTKRPDEYAAYFALCARHHGVPT
jgi:hypothetical protein